MHSTHPFSLYSVDQQETFRLIFLKRSFSGKVTRKYRQKCRLKQLILPTVTQCCVVWRRSFVVRRHQVSRVAAAADRRALCQWCNSTMMHWVAAWMSGCSTALQQLKVIKVWKLSKNKSLGVGSLGSCLGRKDKTLRWYYEHGVGR